MGKTESEMFKLMEQGKVMAADVMPAVAKEFARTAREGGALAAAQIKVNSEYQRFLNGLTMIKDEIFKGGFGEGMAMIFKQTSLMMKEMKPLATFMGGALKGALTVVTGAFKLLAVPIDIVSNLLEGLGSFWSGLVGGGGLLLLLTSRLLGIGKAMGFIATTTTMTGAAFKALPPIAAAIVAEDIYRGAFSRDTHNSITNDLISASGTPDWIKRTQESTMERGFWKTVNPALAYTFEFFFKDGAEDLLGAKIQNKALTDIATEVRR